MKNLSNELLVAAYIKAIQLGLDKDFQLLLREEVLRRNMELSCIVATK